jgi:hypothetical protein
MKEKKDSMNTISASNYSHHFHHDIFGSKPEDDNG